MYSPKLTNNLPPFLKILLDVEKMLLGSSKCSIISHAITDPKLISLKSLMSLSVSRSTLGEVTLGALAESWGSKLKYCFLHIFCTPPLPPPISKTFSSKIISLPKCFRNLDKPPNCLLVTSGYTDSYIISIHSSVGAFVTKKLSQSEQCEYVVPHDLINLSHAVNFLSFSGSMSLERQKGHWLLSEVLREGKAIGMPEWWLNVSVNVEFAAINSGFRHMAGNPIIPTQEHHLFEHHPNSPFLLTFF